MATIAARLKNPMLASKARTSCRTTPTTEISADVCSSGYSGGSFSYEPISIGDLLPPTTMTETADTLRILIPLCGVDLRQAYVIATTRSIIVEFRIKHTVIHAGIAGLEVQQHRFIRKLKFEVNLKRGSTSVRMMGDDLEITAMKAGCGGDLGWSDLVRFDTRLSGLHMNVLRTVKELLDRSCYGTKCRVSIYTIPR